MIAGPGAVSTLIVTINYRTARFARSIGNKENSMRTPTRSTANPAQTRERRKAPRRRRSVRVLFMSNDCALDEPFRATLLDASPGGLRLAVRREQISEGSLLMVMPPQAPPGTAWVPVLVKNCRPKDDAWEVGCQFTQRVPAQTIQLFAS